MNNDEYILDLFHKSNLPIFLLSKHVGYCKIWVLQ